MGLDNGLIIKGKTIKGKEYLKKNFSYLRDDDDATNEYELGYWRKCWNIRNRAISAELAEDGTSKHLTLEDLYDFVENVLKYYLNEDNWNRDNSSSIWSWDVGLKSIANCIFNIRRLLEDYDYGDISNEDFDIYFYDSY